MLSTPYSHPPKWVDPNPHPQTISLTLGYKPSTLIHTSPHLSTLIPLSEVFDDKKTFTDWFDTMLDGAGDDVESQLLATEKKLVVVHRLHQILVPFMLRRQV